MTEPEIWTFFYGSYMNLDVLKEAGYVPRLHEPARLPGFDLSIGPLANLIRSEQHTAYGIIATGTHTELARLYDHAETVLGGKYLPEPVLVVTADDRWLPALTYIAPELPAKPASDDYIDRLLAPARGHGFPNWYLDRIESFRS